MRKIEELAMDRVRIEDLKAGGRMWEEGNVRKVKIGDPGIGVPAPGITLVAVEFLAILRW